MWLWFTTKIRFRDLRQEYLDTKKGRKKKTIAEAEHFSRRLVEFFGDYPLAQLNEHLWKLYEAHWREKSPRRQLHHDHKHFTAMMKMAYQTKRIERPLKIPKPKSNGNAGREYTLEEMLAMLSAAMEFSPEVKRWGQDLHDQILLATLGMRKMEVLELDWERVNFDRSEIKLRDIDVKTGRPRVVKMGSRVRAMMMRRFSGKIGPYVFPHRKDPTRPRTSNTKAWRAVKKKIGIEGRWHDHRCTAATRLLRAGESEIGTGMSLGMSPEIVRRYAQKSKADLERIADRLDF